MKLMKSASNGTLNTLAKSIKEFFKQNSVDGVNVHAVSEAELNANAGALFMTHALPNGKVVFKPVAVMPQHLLTKKRSLKDGGANNRTIYLPVTATEIVKSGDYMKALRRHVAKTCGVDIDNTVPLPLTAAPVQVDFSEENYLQELARLMYNELAVRIAKAQKDTEATLSYTVDQNGNKESIVVNCDFTGRQHLDSFDQDIRADIQVTVGKNQHTNDDLGEQSESEAGIVTGFVDVMYQPQVQQNAPVAYGQQAPSIPYKPRLVINHFEGPNGIPTMGHALFALANTKAIFGNGQAHQMVAHALYPEYDVPKDQISLRNVGALAASDPVCWVNTPKGQPEMVNRGGQEYLEYMPLHGKGKNGPDVYMNVLGKLLQSDLRVALSLNPTGLNGGVHSTFFKAAVGDGEHKQRAIKEIVQEAVTLTGGSNSIFPADKYLSNKASIFAGRESTQVTYSGEWLNPMTGQFESLARLDGLAAANLLLSDKNAGQVELEAVRRYIDLQLPAGNDVYRLEELYKMMQQLTGDKGNGQNLRISHMEYRPMFTPMFIEDLSTALNAVLNIKVNTIAPDVQKETVRGDTSYSFDQGDSFSGSFGGFGNTGSGNSAWNMGWGSNSGW
jgi:hypothetical protein